MDLARKLQLRPSQHLEIVEAPQSLSSLLVELEQVGEQEAALLFFVGNRSALEDCRSKMVDAAARDCLTGSHIRSLGSLGRI